MSEETLHEVQLWCRADRRTFSLTYHYFQVIGDSEYHLGNYSAPEVLPSGSTKGAELLCVSLVCSICYARVLAALQLQEERRLLAFFPIINCESISTGLSIQSFGLLAMPFVVGLICKAMYAFALILFLLTLCILLAVSKYQFS